MKTFSYHQNNTNGTWQENMPEVLHIMANSAKEADTIAEEKGVYFDGVENGIDCDCCGDRWYRAYFSGKDYENL